MCRPGSSRDIHTVRHSLHPEHWRSPSTVVRSWPWWGKGSRRVNPVDLLCSICSHSTLSFNMFARVTLLYMFYVETIPSTVWSIDWVTIVCIGVCVCIGVGVYREGVGRGGNGVYLWIHRKGMTYYITFQMSSVFCGLPWFPMFYISRSWSFLLLSPSEWLMLGFRIPSIDGTNMTH